MKAEEMVEALLCSTYSDSSDEFTKAREQVEQGDVIFIYRSTERKDVENNLLEVCIRAHNIYTSGPETTTGDLDLYIVELYTDKYSVIYPHVPRTYLDIELYDILKDSKVPDDVLITYKQIIEDLKE